MVLLETSAVLLLQKKRLHLTHFATNISGLDKVKQPSVSFKYCKGSKIRLTPSCSPSTKSDTVWCCRWKRGLIAYALCSGLGIPGDFQPQTVLQLRGSTFSCLACLARGRLPSCQGSFPHWGDGDWCAQSLCTPRRVQNKAWRVGRGREGKRPQKKGSRHT